MRREWNEPKRIEKKLKRNGTTMDNKRNSEKMEEMKTVYANILSLLALGAGQKKTKGSGGHQKQTQRNWKDHERKWKKYERTERTWKEAETKWRHNEQWTENESCQQLTDPNSGNQKQTQ